MRRLVSVFCLFLEVELVAVVYIQYAIIIIIILKACLVFVCLHRSGAPYILSFGTFFFAYTIR